MYTTEAMREFASQAERRRFQALIAEGNIAITERWCRWEDIPITALHFG